MNTRNPFWTIGRDREKAHAAKFAKRQEQQELLFPVIDAALDVNEGCDDEANFIERSKRAMITGDAVVWQNTSGWIRKIEKEHNSVLELWDELASHPSWQVRWRVACLLYNDIPETKADELFAKLRYDKSTKVRQYAIDRYENRPGPDLYVVFKMFDAGDPSSPGFSGCN